MRTLIAALCLALSLPASAATKTRYRMIEGAPVNVLDYGADPTGSVDSSAAFQSAADAAVATGKAVDVPGGTYKVLTTPSSSSPVDWRISHGANFTGTVVNGNWNSLPTAGHCLSNGYNLISKSHFYSAPNTALVDPGAPGSYPFGLFSLTAETRPGTSFLGNADAAYFGAIGQSGANFALGGVNVLSRMEAGFLGNANAAELDIDNFASDGIAGMGLGLVVQGASNMLLDSGVKIVRVAYGTQSATGAIPAWQANHGYDVRDVVTNGGNRYRCTARGTSAGAGGPTGTGTSIVDGSATWTYDASALNWIKPYNQGLYISHAVTGMVVDQSQVQAPSSAILLRPGQQGLSSDPLIAIKDYTDTTLFYVRRDGYIGPRTSAGVSSFGTNVASTGTGQALTQYMMPDGWVRLAGNVTSTSGTITSGTTLFTLDGAYRPNRTIIVPIMQNNGVSTWLQITSAGVATSGANLTDAFTLDLNGVEFRQSN